MFALVACAVILAGLGTALFVIRRRERRARRPAPPPRPDPQLVDRPFDPSRCGFCDERGNHACPACRRPLCNEHRPWPDHRFCWPCEREWERGARKRAIVIAPIVLGVAAAAAGGLLGLSVLLARATGFASGKLMIAVFVVPLGLGAPMYAKLERRLRRRFKPTSNLPSATLR